MYSYILDRHQLIISMDFFDKHYKNYKEKSKIAKSWLEQSSEIIGKLKKSNWKYKELLLNPHL